MNPWKLTYEKFIPEEENLHEALCTLGNGYFGTRGSAPESGATKVHYPGTYIAGVYNELITPIADRKVANEDFVNCPNWLMFNYRIGSGPWFERLKVKVLSWRKELNMRRGVLMRRMRWQDADHRITLIEEERIVSMADPHYGALRFTITPENYSGTITFRSGLDGLVINAGVERYRQLNSKHLEACQSGEIDQDGVFLQVQTNQSKIQISQAQKTVVFQNQNKIDSAFRIVKQGKERISQEFTLNVSGGEKIRIEKIVAIYTSRDHGIDDNCRAAVDAVKKIDSFSQLYKPHQARWRALWKRFDIELEGDPLAQMALRLHTFHLLQVASVYNEEIDAGLPARGLHGEAYRGHIFWDEMYVFPFYNLRAPEITRALLMYRYRRLKAAKEYAKEHGYRGAMFPWQSASKGNETSQVVHLNPMSGQWGPDFSSLQRHVSIAVAYNVWTYYSLSNDRVFLNQYGAEILIEIAHFWSSIATFHEGIERYEIKGVMGPDEFHEKLPGSERGGLDNNAYTNLMVVWVLNKALQTLELFTEEERHALLVKTEISSKEIERWRDIARRMKVPIEDNGLIHQFDGYMDLKELDWDEYRAKYDNIHRIDRILKAEGLSPDDYKVAKQADVLMIFYLLNDQEIEGLFNQLGYQYSKDVFEVNYKYYIARTSHGSTLSRVVHGYLAERLGYEEDAIRFYMEALRSDMEDIQGGTTKEGIHTGVMGGTIDVFLKCFGGLSFEQDCLCLNPKVPEDWKKIAFQVRCKDFWYHIEATCREVCIAIESFKKMGDSPQEVTVVIRGKRQKVILGKPLAIPIKNPINNVFNMKKILNLS